MSKFIFGRICIKDYIMLLYAYMYISIFDLNVFLLTDNFFMISVDKILYVALYVAKMIIWKLYFCHLRLYFFIMISICFNFVINFQ